MEWNLWMVVAIYAIPTTYIVLNVISTKRWRRQFSAFQAEYWNWRSRRMDEASAEPFLLYEMLELIRLLDQRGSGTSFDVVKNLSDSGRCFLPWIPHLEKALKDPLVYGLVKRDVGLQDAYKVLIRNNAHREELEEIREKIQHHTD